MTNRLLLHCDAMHSSFTLAQEGGDQRQSFTDLQEALNHAARMVTEETPIRIFNELGKLVIESTITPRSQREAMVT